MKAVRYSATLLCGMTAALLADAAALALPFDVPDMDAADAPAVKLIADWERADGEGSLFRPAVDITLPVLPGVETALTVGPAHLRSDGDRDSGSADSEWTLKWEILPVPDGGGFGVSAEGALLIPTGSRGMGDDEWRFDLPVIFGWHGAAVGVQGMFGYSASLSGGEDALLTGLRLTHAIGDAVEAGAELVGTRTLGRNGALEAHVNLGVSWAAAEAVTIEALVGHGVRSPGGPAPTRLMASVEFGF